MPFRVSSLRTALLVPFVGLVILVAAAIGGLSYLTGVRAVEDFSNQILRDVSNRVTQATTQHFAVSKVALNAVAPDAASFVPGASASVNALTPQSLDEIEQRLWLATGLFPDVSGYVYFGGEDGRFVGVNRSAAGTELRVKDKPDVERVAYRSSGPGLRGDRLRSDVYDPRTRPWYKAAIGRGGLAWSPVYIAATSRALTITLAKPMYDGSGKLRGVVATDIPLKSLDDFVASLKVSQNGVAFVVERDGSLIATSNAQPLVAEVSGASVSARRLRATEASDPLIRAAFGSLGAISKPNANDGALKTSRFQSEQFDIVDFAANAQTDDAGLDWTMIVAVPRADHMTVLRRTAWQNFAIAALAVALAIGLGMWLTQRVSSAVKRLSDATRLLASGHMPNGLALDRNDELGSIAKTVNELSAGLLHDPLTSALNRSTFEKRFEARATAVVEARATPFALVFVDLDKFKRINDNFGHAMGDAVLAISAQRLASVLRKDDLLCRYGGDEFIALLGDVADEAALDNALARIQDALVQPIVVAGHALSVAASCGGALFPANGQSLGALTAYADARMYREKGVGSKIRRA